MKGTDFFRTIRLKRWWRKWQIFKDDRRGHSRSRARFWLKQILLGVGDILLLVLIFSIGVAGYFFANTPKAELVHREVAQTSIIYDRTGEHVLYEIHGEENRKMVGHDQINDSIRIATVAAEDDSFYSHWGVDIPSIIRAFRVDFRENDLKQGASTITQQLARNVFLSSEKSWERKVRETALAMKIEFRYSKDEILDFYLNEVPYGSNAYGIQSAAQVYFGKDAKDLTLDEAALLAALNKATTYYSPYGNHTDLLVARQKKILERIKSLKQADEKIVEEAIQADTLAKILPFREEVVAPHFVFFINEYLEKNYGKEMVESGGLRIFTTLDLALQETAERTVKEAVETNGKKHNFSNGALVALDPRNGEVLAMAGSRDFFDTQIDGQVNVATSERQPGSSFKPLVYAKAFEKGYQPETVFFDTPTNFGPDGTGKDYVPQNYNGKFSGMVSMREALSRSLNIPAIKTLYLAGIPETIDLAERLGIKTLTRKNDYGLALAIGGGEVTLLEETGAFSVFANDGIRNNVHGIKKIETANGEVLEEATVKGSQVIDREVARKINSILSDNGARTAVFGAKSPLAFSERSVAAKTGTTQDFRDAWTVGYTPALAVGVWVGNNNSSLMRPGSDGVVVAAPVWRKFMDAVLPRYPNDQFIPYSKVESSNLMVTGNISKKTKYFSVKSGKKVSEDKRRKMDPEEIRVENVPDEKHDILFYVNRNDPLGSGSPNRFDLMAARWDKGVNDYFDPPKEDKEKD